MTAKSGESHFGKLIFTPTSSRTFTRWFVGAVLLGSALLAWFVPIVPRAVVPEWLLFVGRFHPLVLHLPIGLLVLLPMLHLLARFSPPNALRPVIVLVLWLTVLSVFAAAMSGLMLSQEGGYDGDTLLFHRRLAIVLTVLTALLLLSESESANASGLSALAARRSLISYRALLPLTLICLGSAAHLGASLTHGSTFLTEHLPTSIKARLGMGASSPNTGGDEVYSSRVAPILSSRCTSCHGSEKAKGGLRLHTLEATLAGGDSQRDERKFTVAPGKPDESLLISALCLPEDDDAHMPPTGKPQLTADQIATLREWIQTRAVAQASDKK